MSIQQSGLAQFVANCQVGDCLHWWGGSWLSRQIERQTSGGPSHVAMVRRIDDRDPTKIILVESTQVSQPKRFIGVIERSFWDEYSEYKDGSAQGVWCPLSPALRVQDGLWVGPWGTEADKHIGDPYSFAQMVLEAYNSLVVSNHIPVLEDIAADFARGNWRQEFCSQLWCILFQKAGFLSTTRIPGLTAPTNSWQAAIYGPAQQILGPPLILENDLRYNTVAA